MCLHVCRFSIRDRPAAVSHKSAIDFSILMQFSGSIGREPTMTNYLDRLLNPVADTFSESQARKILEIRADAELQARIEALREKANEGTLSSEEDAEYKDFIEAVDVISILQAKARAILEKTAA
jgi:hypothetical protein